MKGSWDNKTLLIAFLQWLFLLLVVIIILLGLYWVLDQLQKLLVR